jgi:DNA-binding NarL/FixJ family response regulator
VTAVATGAVLVIDDQALVAASLAYALSAEGFDAHRLPVTDLDAVADAALEQVPGVALVDLDLGTGADGHCLDGVGLVAPLCAQGWAVLVVTGTTELDRVAAAIAAGAANWVVKGAEVAELVAATVELAAGRGALPEVERRAMIQRHREAVRTAGRVAEKLGRLSRKEREVLDRLAAGASAASIAEESYTSIRTVRAHIRSILAKLDVNSQGAATAIAREHPARAQPIPAGLWRRMRGSLPRG